MHKWESVKALQYYCGSLDFTRLCDLRRLRFLHKIRISAHRACMLLEILYFFFLAISWVSTWVV